MVVRSAVILDVCLITICGLFAWASVSWAHDLTVYSSSCHGRSAWLCELVKSTRGHDLIGYNPVLLVVSVLFGWMALFGLLRLGCGWTARLGQDEVQVLRPWGIARIPRAMIEHVSVKERLFGSIAEIVVHTVDGRKFVGANGKVDDAARFKAALKPASSAPPATPPAT